MEDLGSSAVSWPTVFLSGKSVTVGTTALTVLMKTVVRLEGKLAELSTRPPKLLLNSRRKF